MKSSIELTLFAVLLFACKAVDSPQSCGSVEFPTEFNIDDPPIPAGTIRISDNLFIDKSELTNLDYREFIFWTMRIYGPNSEEFLNTVPDIAVWSSLHPGYDLLDTIYFSSEDFLGFPVVGVSHEQALTYAKWRSDRVMEMMLIRNGIIPVKRKPPQDSIFTIERYFSGQYYGIEPDERFLYYPHYSLPDSSTFMKAFLFADSLNAENYKYCRERRCGDQLLTENNCLENIANRTEVHPYGPVPTKQARCSFCRKELITHLKGNVRELTNLEGYFYGNSFIDSCNTPYNVIRRDTSLVNSYTGFRNVCEYRKWKE
ncbi:MAG: hypothetical protein EA409_11565 [Saprospirales bacterium]|nr:MAG: hypothetical protein EA409_11565 [Saprospirales bacterium]